MEKDKRSQRIEQAQAYIVSGEFARSERVEEGDEPVDDPSYRVKEDRERSREVLAGFLDGKVFEKVSE